MLPVLFSIGPISVSSFGLSLVLAFLAAVFIAWRLAKAYDLNEGKILDLAILTLFAGLIGSRLYFIIFNYPIFNDLMKIVLINRYPGMVFWGGLLGGGIALTLLTMRTKLNYWQIADISAVSLILGLAIGNIGCFLGGCSYGVISSLPFATTVTGVLGKRFPISVLESLILFISFMWLWKQAIRFHFQGKITALALIILGTLKYFAEFYRGDSQPFWKNPLILWGQIPSVALIIVGLGLYYWRSKRSVIKDILYLFYLIISSKKRDQLLSQLRKTCYNIKIGWSIKLNKIKISLQTSPNRLKRKLNVKSTPQDYR